jgi:hypothetical protein
MESLEKPAEASTADNHAEPTPGESQQLLSLLIRVCSGQIHHALHDGAVAADSLSVKFSTLREDLQKVVAACQAGAGRELMEEIDSRFESVNARMNEMVMLQQFYDRFTQRLTNIAATLDQLSGTTAGPATAQLQAVKTQLREKCTSEVDRIFLDRLFDGDTLALALDVVKQHNAQTKDHDDIELF